MPDLPIVTIHDSIAVPEGCEEIVRQVIEQEFFAIGLLPRIKVEPWRSSEFLEIAI